MTSTLLHLDNISLGYGQHQVIKNISLRLQEGEIGCLLGSSGCGKTTLLRSIAGFETPDQGRITIRKRLVNSDSIHITPEKRNVGMVFQDFALFPHLTTRENIGFGLNKLSRAQRTQRVDELLELVNLNGSCHKYPHELSGGQQQRVALARAMAPRPELLLLDEPFSSLDIELREQLAREVARIIRQEGITAILVTHDQQEAFAMADKIGLLHNGCLVQWDTPYQLYHQPATQYAANFIGRGVMLPGQVKDQQSITTALTTIHGKVPPGCKPGCPVEILIRPDDIIHDDKSSLKLEIIDRAFQGAEFLYTLKVTGDQHILCLAPSHHNHDIGKRLGIRLDISHIVIFKK